MKLIETPIIDMWGRVLHVDQHIEETWKLVSTGITATLHTESECLGRWHYPSAFIKGYEHVTGRKVKLERHDN